MDELTNLSKEFIDRYFNILGKLGYKNYNSVYKLIVLLFTEEMLSNDELCLYITEDDYRTIVNVVDCIYRSDCLFSIIEYDNTKDIKEILLTYYKDGYVSKDPDGNTYTKELLI